MPFYEVLNRPRVPVRAGVAADTYGPYLLMVLERGERHLPDFAGLLNHDGMIGARLSPCDQRKAPQGEGESREARDWFVDTIIAIIPRPGPRVSGCRQRKAPPRKGSYVVFGG
jgi:hypothetical protein